jgi:hypothetical protein
MGKNTDILNECALQKPMHLSNEKTYIESGTINPNLVANQENFDYKTHEGFVVINKYSKPVLIKEHMNSYGEYFERLISRCEVEKVKFGFVLSPEGCVRPMQTIQKQCPRINSIPRIYASRVGDYQSDYDIDIWSNINQFIEEADILLMAEDLIDSYGTFEKTKRKLYLAGFNGKLAIIPTAVKLTPEAYNRTYLANPLFIPNAWLISGPGFDGSNGGYGKFGEIGLIVDVAERNANVVLAHKYTDPLKSKNKFDPEKHIESLLYNEGFTNYSDLVELTSSQEFIIHREIAYSKHKNHLQNKPLRAQEYGELIEAGMFGGGER